MVRINCHSAFKHYEMFHSGGHSGGNYGSVFNTTINLSGGWGGGFWSGLGYGFGNAFGSLFGGMFGNMFGDGMNMFGGGMGLFGGGFGNFGNFGGFGGFGNWGWGGSTGGVSGSSNNSGKCTCGCKDKESTTDKEDECKDSDRAKLNKIGEDVNALMAKSNPTQAEAKKLYDRILKEKEASAKDPNHKDTDAKDYDNWLKNLNEWAKNKGLGDLSQKPETEVTNPDKQTEGGGGVHVKEKETPKAKEAEQADGTVTIDGNPVKLTDLTVDQIGKLTPEQIGKLKADEAKALLDKLGLLCTDDDGKEGVKATTNYKALLLVKQSGLPLACGHNTSLDNIQGADAYINGTIDNVELNGDTISFEIDDDNMLLKMTCKADSTTYQIAQMIKNKTDKYKQVTVGTAYEIKSDDNDDYAVRNGAAAIKK